MLFKPPLGWADTLAMKIDGLLQNVCAEFSVFCPLLKNTRRIHAGSRFYIPNNFRKSGKWIPQENRGKIIEFTLAAKKTA